MEKWAFRGKILTVEAFSYPASIRAGETPSTIFFSPIAAAGPEILRAGIRAAAFFFHNQRI
jgi:hypothetical protein